ncbi:polysaccharide deacetylase family protein [Terriglobus aquaticus]|uniref:Polysaccharide deacetylase family protein n=1 Tax=Terriglobus aquaticus TaxID=940139 RepID=A0ABW9KN16_9BACT|nr:polysaccharide deacetylase family protein [Terriglobus aquaticus]
MQTWQTAAVVTAAGVGALGLVTGGLSYAAGWPTSQIFGKTLIDVPDPDPSRHTVALTYDDGPSARNTEPLLELLAEHGVRATFFLIGNHVRRHPAIARRVASAGHLIGNHTEMHPNLARKSDARVRTELERTQAILQDTLGISPRVFRAPYGSRRPGVFRIARSLGLEPVQWNVTAHDWEPLGSERILRNVDRGIEQNRKRGRTSNVLLHDASHLDGDSPHSRADSIAVTAALVARPDLQFVTVDRWIEKALPVRSARP